MAALINERIAAKKKADEEQSAAESGSLSSRTTGIQNRANPKSYDVGPDANLPSRPGDRPKPPGRRPRGRAGRSGGARTALG